VRLTAGAYYYHYYYYLLIVSNNNNNNKNKASNLIEYYNSHLNQDVTKGKPQNHITGQIIRHPNQ